jgi:RNA polymerase sigma-32 factor
MNRRLSGDISLNVSLNQDGDSGEWQDRLVDETSDQESLLAESEESERRSRALKMAIKVLDDRERHIFEARRLIDPPRRLGELAIEYRISRERVRQIEARAFQKVQRVTHSACARRQHSSTAHRVNSSCGSICAAKRSCVQ